VNITERHERTEARNMKDGADEGDEGLAGLEAAYGTAKLRRLVTSFIPNP
jgi:hypothetical protein